MLLLYISVCAQYIMQQCAGTWTWALECLHAFKKHARVLRHTMWSIVTRNAEDNGETLNRVGSRNIRGTERGENIQFNFETVPAQSTNTKASLQADPCWRLELIHHLQAQGEKTAWGKVGEQPGDQQAKRCGDSSKRDKGENWGKT